MRGKMDTDQHQYLATDALCGTLCTIGVMQKYLKHRIENHPAISSEYVKFLVSNSPLVAVIKLEGELKSLGTKIEEVGSKVKAAQSTANVAQNTAVEAKKIAEKSQNED